MPRFVLNKLVRDRIVEHQLSSGQKPKYRKLSDTEFKKELVNKIIEESKELINANKEDITDEIADVQQVLDDLIEKLNIDPSIIKSKQRQKSKENGAFKEGIYIDYVELDEDDPFTQYYRKDPERFPELDK